MDIDTSGPATAATLNVTAAGVPVPSGIAKGPPDAGTGRGTTPLVAVPLVVVKETRDSVPLGLASVTVKVAVVRPLLPSTIVTSLMEIVGAVCPPARTPASETPWRRLRAYRRAEPHGRLVTVVLWVLASQVVMFALMIARHGYVYRRPAT
jgi:hypothetical protein